jgi:hypothetical protein
MHTLENKPDVIAHHLKHRKTIKYGARAAELNAYNLPLVDLLYPPGLYPRLSDLARAVQAELMIRHACKVPLAGPAGQALMIFYALAPGMPGTSLDTRQYHMGKLLGVAADTVRRKYRRDQLINSLAVELHKMCVLGQSGTTECIPDVMQEV